MIRRYSFYIAVLLLSFFVEAKEALSRPSAFCVRSQVFISKGIRDGILIELPDKNYKLKLREGDGSPESFINVNKDEYSLIIRDKSMEITFKFDYAAEVEMDSEGVISVVFSTGKYSIKVDYSTFHPGSGEPGSRFTISVNPFNLTCEK